MRNLNIPDYIKGAENDNKGEIL